MWTMQSDSKMFEVREELALMRTAELPYEVDGRFSYTFFHVKSFDDTRASKKSRPSFLRDQIEFRFEDVELISHCQRNEERGNTTTYRFT